MIRLRFTALWFLFGPVLGCMWLAAVNYENNLVYAVLYLVAALSFVSIFHTWRNLASVEVEHVRVKPSFAGEEIELEIHLRNRGNAPSYNLSFERLDRRKRRPVRSRKGTNLKAGDARVVTAFLPASARGRYLLEKIVVRSAYPFGLFWAQLRAPAQAVYYVYPAPHGRDELPEMQAPARKARPSVRAMTSPACALIRRASRCGTSTGKPTRAGVRWWSSNSPAARAANSGWTRARWRGCRWRNGFRN